MEKVLKKKIRKQRTATHRKVNQFLKTSSKCHLFDGFDKSGVPITECFYPWWRECTGDPFQCKKQYYKHLQCTKTQNNGENSST